MKLAVFTWALECLVIVMLIGCSNPMRGHYSHEYLECSMSDGRYQMTIDIERATGAPSGREHQIFQQVCVSAEGLARPTIYHGPVVAP